MTSKDFRLIARTIASLPDNASKAAIIDYFTVALRQTNPAFDASRFAAAAKGCPLSRRDA
jgi:hypothetical protein